jgi:uncharacterized protein YggE
METKPDTIQVSASQREELQASHADLFVSVKGSALVSGDAALKKAREVSQLVEALGQAGLPAGAIHLQSVFAESSGGAVLRSSSAIYRLRIRCQELELFAGLLGAITDQKNASLERVEWKYPEQSALEGALEKAIQKAGAKAQKIAGALGVDLLGVYSFNENILDQETFMPHAIFEAQGKSRAMGVISQPNLGLDIQHSKQVEIRVDLEYRISGFNQA